MRLILATAAIALAGIMATGVSPCAEEDGSGQMACVWVSPDRGNGVGRSFIVVGGSGGVDLTLPSGLARVLTKEKR